MKYEAVLFDFDYTLADATEAIVECFNHALTEFGFPEAEAIRIKKTVGMTVIEAMKTLSGKDDNELFEEMRIVFSKKADEIMTMKTKLYDDTIPILQYLKTKGIKTGIVTNKYRYRIAEVLEKFSISQIVDVVIGYEDVEKRKPNPEAIFTAADKLNLPYDKILYIGDSLVDAEAAQRAGVDFIAVTTGTTESEDFIKYNYKDIIANLSELHRIIEPQNIFDDETFFSGYYELRQNPYSANNVEEKPSLFAMLPDLNGFDILDLGCGYGENCLQFCKMGAKSVTGIDISEKMLDVAENQHKTDNIQYITMSMEDISTLDKKFDLIISSLAIHYIKNFDKLVRDVHSLLNDGGIFIFSQEHPFNTAPKEFLGWNRVENEPLYYKLTDYNISGERMTKWIIDGIVKYHRRFTDIINTLTTNGLTIVKIDEPIVAGKVIEAVPSYIKNHHKPNFLIIKSIKK